MQKILIVSPKAISLVSKNSFPKSLVKNKKAIVYKNDNQLIHYILKLVNNKKIFKQNF